jgi:acyl-CoA thioesterase-1
VNRRGATIVGIAASLVVAVAVVGAVVRHDRATATATAASGVSAATSSKPTAVAIGDSIMDGHGLTVAESWPSVLAGKEGWDLDDLASDGTGYVTLGVDHDTFQAQADAAVALDPSIVILAGSSNDLGKSTAQVQAAEATLVATIAARLPQAQIVAVNTFWGDTTPPAQLTAFDSALDQAVRHAGGTYIDIGQPLANRVDLMQNDDVHPTATGQRVLANSIGLRLPAAL